MSGAGTGARPGAARAQALASRSGTVAALAEFIRFPSVSNDPARAADVRRCGEWLADRIRRAGLERVETIRTPRHPIVLGEWRRAPGRPTVLVYGHYDVQPADPLGEWRSPPFEPTLRGDDLHGRGASDDKGQLLAHVAAIEAYLTIGGELPVNVVCCFEGEEEIGSGHLLAMLPRLRPRLAADMAVISDTRMLGPDRPAITYGLRGSLALELEVEGPRRDLHSGAFGGAVHNPLQALCEIVAGLHRPDGRVAVPGFYERVRAIPPAERAAMARAAPADGQVLRDAAARAAWGEAGYTLHERTTIRPALTVNGLSGGYSGPGGKSVIPAGAGAKLSARLVPDQDPREIARRIGERIARLTPGTVRSRLSVGAATRPVVLDPRHPGVVAAARAYRRGFGLPPALVRSGGTIPVVSAFQEVLGLSSVLMGFALPDDRMHAPNERVNLPTLFKGIATAIAFLDEARRAGGRSRPPRAERSLRGGRVDGGGRQRPRPDPAARSV